MKHVETTISETAVRMRYADHADPLKASRWVEFQFPTAQLKHASGTELPDPTVLRLSVTQVAALRSVQELVAAEIDRLANLASRNPL